EDHALAQLAGLGEEVAHSARANADVLLHEVRSRRMVERHARLGRDGAREHGLAGPWWPIQENAAWHARAQAAEPVRMAQELDRPGGPELGLFAAGAVVEMDEP